MQNNVKRNDRCQDYGTRIYRFRERKCVINGNHNIVESKAFMLKEIGFKDEDEFDESVVSSKENAQAAGSMIITILDKEERKEGAKEIRLE